ncbi:MAG: molybdopterin-binding protein [Planctomycetia bacterium]|nr:molybdopterin-binding protein [Planctomycetia bacterium]
MHAEIISIGDELTSGQRLDTNSQWLSQRLGELGIATRFHTTVSDDLASNVAVFRAAVERADLVISTGGLGPTADDLTREALAEMLGRQLVQDDASLEHIRALFARRQRPMPERNLAQAMFPAGSRPIPNPHGTAPGIAVEAPRADGSVSRVFSLPGVPAELFEMWEQTVAPAIVTLAGRPQVIRHHCVRCFGVGESDLEAMLPDLIRRGRVPSVGITVSDATITLRITSVGDTSEACETSIAPTLATIHECLGTIVYGADEDELADVVLRLLIERGESLVTLEWGHAGLAAAMHQAVEKATNGKSADRVERIRAAYRGGLTIAGPERAGSLLESNVDWTQLTPTSEGMAVALAEATPRGLPSTWRLAAAALPEFLPRANEPNRFHLALNGPIGTRHFSLAYSGQPALLKPRAMKQAINALRLALLQ